jgi:predicted nucleotidyltransferase
MNTQHEPPLSRIKKRIASICEAEPAIAAAYVFGSVAREKGKPSSDVDVALLLNEKKTGDFSVLGFITRLEKQMAGKADLVILNKADEVLKFEVRSRGKLVFERSEEYRKQFEVKSRKFYEDFLYLHKKYVKSVLYGGADGQPDHS